jgi:hypothetical protein
MYGPGSPLAAGNASFVGFVSFAAFENGTTGENRQCR